MMASADAYLYKYGEPNRNTDSNWDIKSKYPNRYSDSNTRVLKFPVLYSLSSVNPLICYNQVEVYL